MNHNFKASWDRRTTIITALGSILIMASCAMLVVAAASETPRSPGMIGISGIWWYWISIAVLIAVLLITFFVSPRSYTVETGQLIIERPLNRKVFELRATSTVQLISPDSGAGHGFRLWGSGGMFGYFGIFHNSDLGKYYLAATRSSNRVLVTTASGKKVVITPDDTAALIGALNAAVKNGSSVSSHPSVVGR